MGMYGVYTGYKAISNFTNYNSQKWNNRLFVYVEQVTANGDSKVVYQGYIAESISTVYACALKALTVDVKVCVVYPNLS